MTVCGKTALMASGKPFRPSTTAIRMSWAPRFFSSFIARSQNLAPSVCSIQAEDLLSAVRQDAKRDVDRLIAPEALVADLDPNGIEKHQWVADIERPVLPFRNLVQHRISDRRDQVGRDINAVEFLEVAADLPDRHAAGGDDLLVKVRKPALVFGNQFRIEGPSPIARHRQCHLRSASQNRLLRITVAVISFGFAAVAVQMLVNLSVQNPLR